MRAQEFINESKVADIKRLARAAAKKFKAGDESQANNPHPTDSYLGKVWKETFNKMLARIPDEPAMEGEEMPSVKTYGPMQLALTHNVPLEQIMSELMKGIEIEFEHTTNRNQAMEIALDHLLEMPDYYTKLEKMENESIVNEVKAGPFKSKAIGSKVVIRGTDVNGNNEHTGKTGWITAAEREHTFSSMHPFVVVYRVDFDDYEHAYVRREHVRKVK